MCDYKLEYKKTRKKTKSLQIPLRQTSYELINKRTMKRYSTFVILAASIFICACDGNKKKTDDAPSVIVKTIDEIPGIFEAYGTIGSGTSMNMIEFINEDGDTIYLQANSQSVAGGVKVGDKLDVVYNVTDDANIVSLAVNITSLQHVWNQKGNDGQEQSLELDEGGRATTYNMNVDYDSWSVENGQLLLRSPKSKMEEKAARADTFDIMLLNTDSLVLMHGDLMTEFERYN